MQRFKSKKETQEMQCRRNTPICQLKKNYGRMDQKVRDFKWLLPARVLPTVLRLFSGSLEKSKLAWGICKCLWHCFQSHLNSLGSFFAWSMFSKATIDKHDLALPLSFIIVGKLPLTPPCSKNCLYRVSHQLFWNLFKTFHTWDRMSKILRIHILS